MRTTNLLIWDEVFINWKLHLVWTNQLWQLILIEKRDLVNQFSLKSNQK